MKVGELVVIIDGLRDIKYRNRCEVDSKLQTSNPSQGDVDEIGGYNKANIKNVGESQVNGFFRLGYYRQARYRGVSKQASWVS
jgi:hypothetical protein